MRWLPGTLVILLGAVALAAACARPPAFASFTSEKQEFSIGYPRGWRAGAARAAPPGLRLLHEREAEVLNRLPAGLGDRPGRRRRPRLVPALQRRRDAPVRGRVPAGS